MSVNTDRIDLVVGREEMSIQLFECVPACVQSYFQSIVFQHIGGSIIAGVAIRVATVHSNEVIRFVARQECGLSQSGPSVDQWLCHVHALERVEESIVANQIGDRILGVGSSVWGQATVINGLTVQRRDCDILHWHCRVLGPWFGNRILFGSIKPETNHLPVIFSFRFRIRMNRRKTKTNMNSPATERTATKVTGICRILLLDAKLSKLLI